MGKKRKIGPKQEEFAQEYNISLNATRAYEKVYKCSLAAADTAGPRLLGNVRVKARIEVLKARAAKRNELTKDMVINELRKLGFSNIKSFIGVGNKILDISTLADEITAAVESIQSDKDGKVKCKLHDKKGSLVELGRHLGIFEKDNNQKNIDLVPRITYEEVARRMVKKKKLGTGLDVKSIEGGG